MWECEITLKPKAMKSHDSVSPHSKQEKNRKVCCNLVDWLWIKICWTSTHLNKNPWLQVVTIWPILQSQTRTKKNWNPFEWTLVDWPPACKKQDNDTQQAATSATFAGTRAQQRKMVQKFLRLHQLLCDFEYPNIYGGSYPCQVVSRISEPSTLTIEALIVQRCISS